MSDLVRNTALDSMQLPSTVQNYRRVLNAMNFDLFSDFNLIEEIDTSRAVIDEDGSIHLSRDEYMDQLNVICKDNDGDAYGDGLMHRGYRGVVRCGMGVELQPYEGTPGGGTLLPGFDKSALQIGTWGSGDGAKPALLHRNGFYAPAWRDLNPDGTLDLLLRDFGGKPSIQRMGGAHVHYRKGSRTEIGRSFGGCQGTLRWKDMDELLDLFRTKNNGDICSRFIILSHWLQSPTDVVRSEWQRILTYKEACLGSTI